MKGTSKTVILRSFSFFKVRVERMAGTLHPIPIKRELMLFTHNHFFFMGESKMKETLAIYPTSSKK